MAVAPHVGAWIETYKMQQAHLSDLSLPTWERGLKHAQRGAFPRGVGRSPRGSVD